MYDIPTIQMCVQIWLNLLGLFIPSFYFCMHLQIWVEVYRHWGFLSFQTVGMCMNVFTNFKREHVNDFENWTNKHMHGFPTTSILHSRI